MKNDELIKKLQTAEAELPNEAQTRFEIIDEILFGPLGWDRNDAKVESSTREDDHTTFRDYTLSTERFSIVVEAKRLRFADEPYVSRSRKLKGKWLEGALGDAVRQARDYARKASVQFAAVTDGSVWVIFPAFRTDQIPFEESSAVIFHNYQSALGDDFEELEALLAKQAVARGSLQKALLPGRPEKENQLRLNSRFDYAVAPKRASDLYPLIMDAVNDAFTDDLINQDADILEKCYVSIPQRMKFDSKVQLHVQRRSNPTGRRPTRALKQSNKQALPNILKAASSQATPSAIMVMGPVGAGKTTFLHYTRKVTAKALFEGSDEGRAHWIYINFKGFDRLVSDVKGFVYDQLLSYINSDSYLSDYESFVSKAFKEELDALFRGPMSLISKDQNAKNAAIAAHLKEQYDKLVPYVDKVIEYAGKKHAVFLIFDNVDQIEDIDIQSDIISTVFALSSRTSSSIVVCMRETTYQRVKSSPQIDAFNYDPIVIDPPEIKPVLSQRFTVARELLRNRPAKFHSETGIPIETDDLSVFVDVLRDSALDSDVAEVIDVLASGDIRLALRMTRAFIEAGYSEPARAIQFAERGETYKLPTHEAIRSIILGGSPVYRDKLSVIGNVFDAGTGRTSEQFLRLFIIQFLVKESRSKREFFQVQEISDDLLKIGFQPEVTLQILNDLQEKRFIQTQSHNIVGAQDSVYPTRLSGHFVRNYSNKFVIIENLMMDTPVMDKNTWDDLVGLTTSIHSDGNVLRRIKNRVKRSQLFYAYCERELGNLVTLASKHKLGLAWRNNCMTEGKRQFRIETSKVVGSAHKHYDDGNVPG